MAEYVNLIGAEDVSRAGYTMRDAAQAVAQAASNISHSLEMHQRFLDDWLLRFTEAMQIASHAGETIRSAHDEAMEASPVTAQPAVGEVSPSASDRPRMRRSEVPAYLMEKHGIPIAFKTLNKMASFGGGPAIQYAGRIPLYRPEDLDAWAEQRLSAPVTSTAGRHNRG